MKKKLLASLRTLMATFLMLFATNLLPVLTVLQPTAAADDLGKVFVCKYVGTPGVDETLQTGQNPISVSVHSIKDYTGVGSYFSDAQGRSYVLAEDNTTGGGQTGEPNVSECPAPEGGPVTATAPTFNDECGTDDDTIVIPAVDHVYYTVNGNTVSGTLPASGSTTVVAHADNGYTLTGTTEDNNWTQVFTDDACELPTATATAPTFNDLCGADEDTIVIPTVDHVYYTINGNTVTGTLPASGTTTVVAHADDGYQLTGDTNSWSQTFTNEACDEGTGSDKTPTPGPKTTPTDQGGEVLAAVTTVPAVAATTTAPQLANTGDSIWTNIFVGLSVMTLALGTAFASRKQTNS